MWTVSSFQPRTAEHSLPSWTAADPFQLVKVFPNTTTCSGFISPGRDAAGLALHTLMKSWCQTLCFLLTTSLSIWPAETASDSLWSQAESQIFPSHPHTGGFALLPNAAFSSWHMQQSTRLFQIKTESSSQPKVLHGTDIHSSFQPHKMKYLVTFQNSTRTFFQNLLPEWVITAQFKKDP